MKELMIFLDQNTRNKSKSKFSPVLFINNVQPTTLPALVVTISNIHRHFLLKKCEKLLQCKSFSHFFNKKKNISVFGYKVIKHLTS